jgi:hypothetical protein
LASWQTREVPIIPGVGCFGKQRPILDKRSVVLSRSEVQASPPKSGCLCGHSFKFIALTLCEEKIYSEVLVSADALIEQMGKDLATLVFFRPRRVPIILRPSCLKGVSTLGQSRNLPMARSCSVLLAAVLVMGFIGCRSVSPPDWLHPGPAAHQQSRAEQYDPYPENESGPEIIGARPREYQKPPAEPLRARWIPWSWQFR